MKSRWEIDGPVVALGGCKGRRELVGPGRMRLACDDLVQVSEVLAMACHAAEGPQSLEVTVRRVLWWEERT